MEGFYRIASSLWTWQVRIYNIQTHVLFLSLLIPKVRYQYIKTGDGLLFKSLVRIKILCIDLLRTNSTEQNPSWKFTSRSVKICCCFYKTGKFVFIFTKPRPWTLLWSIWVQYYWRPVVTLFSHPCMDFPNVISLTIFRPGICTCFSSLCLMLHCMFIWYNDKGLFSDKH